MNLKEIISEIRACFPARRGSLSKQYFEGANGTCYGPYYVLSRSEGGRTKSLRIPSDHVDTVMEELDRGKRLDELIEGIWAIAEEACLKLGSLKKKRHSPR